MTLTPHSWTWWTGFLVHRHDLAPTTATNYRHAIHGFADWCHGTLGRPAEVGDVEPGTVETYLAFRKASASAQCARVAWVALRSLAKFLAERRIQHENGESTLRLVRMRLHIRAATSKSVHSRDVTIPIEALKALDGYVADHRQGDTDEGAPLFTDRRGRPLSGNAVRKLFERLKVRTGIRDLCAHMLRHTWATNYNRSGSGSSFDLQVEGGWTTPRMVDRYCKVRPLAERRRAPSPFTAPRAAVADAEKRPAEMRPPQQRNVLPLRRARARDQ